VPRADHDLSNASQLELSRLVCAAQIPLPTDRERAGVGTAPLAVSTVPPGDIAKAFFSGALELNG
jgi:hypothetical protein